MRLIGARCKHGDMFSQRILIGRGLFLRVILPSRLLAVQFSGRKAPEETKAGVNGNEVPPVPIPNTEVKLIRVENTWLETTREDRSMPAQPRDFSLGCFFFLCIFCLQNVRKHLIFSESYDIIMKNGA